MVLSVFRIKWSVVGVSGYAMYLLHVWMRILLYDTFIIFICVVNIIKLWEVVITVVFAKYYGSSSILYQSSVNNIFYRRYILLYCVHEELCSFYQHSWLSKFSNSSTSDQCFILCLGHSIMSHQINTATRSLFNLLISIVFNN